MNFSLQLSYIFILINKLQLLNLVVFSGGGVALEEICEVVGGGVAKIINRKVSFWTLNTFVIITYEFFTKTFILLLRLLY